MLPLRAIFFNQPTQNIKKALQNVASAKKTKNSFYVCRIKNDDLSTTGLICKMQTNQLKKAIFHEETKEEKVKVYRECFEKNRLQLSPIILSHQGCDKIDKLIELALKNPAEIIFFENEKSYEFWKIKECNNLQNFYHNLDCFFVVDGHHRLNAIRQSQVEYFSAFFISKNDLISIKYSKNYHNFNEKNLSKFLLFLEKEFELEEVAKIPNLTKEIAFAFAEKITLIKNSEDPNSWKKILNFLDKTFPAHKKSRSKTYSKSTKKNTLHLFIPKLPAGWIKNFKTPLPPQSTWFEPKIPGGIIMMSLE